LTTARRRGYPGRRDHVSAVPRSRRRARSPTGGEKLRPLPSRVRYGPAPLRFDLGARPRSGATQTGELIFFAPGRPSPSTPPARPLRAGYFPSAAGAGAALALGSSGGPPGRAHFEEDEEEQEQPVRPQKMCRNKVRRAACALFARPEPLAPQANPQRVSDLRTALVFSS
jgi:hypothetical protein